MVAILIERRAPISRIYVAQQGIVMSNWSNKFRTFRSHSSVFALEKQAKNLNFESFFLALIDTLVVTLIETDAPTSRKNVAKQGIAMQNWSKTFQIFWSHSSVFAIKNSLKIQFFRVFLSLIDPLLATFNEARAPTSRKYVAEQHILMPNWSKTFPTFWSDSPVFALEKLP